MRTASRSFLATVVASLAVAFWAVPQADARRIGGVHVRPHVGHVYAHPGARIARRNYYRRGRWVNGVWVAAGVAATAAAVGTGNCNYYYRKWKNTGSAYWRNRYYDYCY